VAGRGVDIKLGGNPATAEQEQEVKDLGGLFVLGTERHDARRIDDQLRGRAGRQGDVGETQFYVSLDDPIMKIFGGDRIRGIVSTLGLRDDEAIQNKMISKQLENAQEKVEGFHFDGRKAILDYDNVLSYQRDTIYERRQKIVHNDRDILNNIEADILKVSEDFSKKIKGKKEELTDNEYYGALKQITLYVTDQLWMQHLQVMDYTRQSVNLRAYGQRDPLVEYKKEGLRLYQEMGTIFTNKVAELLAHVEIRKAQEQTEIDNQGQKDTPSLIKADSVQIVKQGEVRTVKKKKLQTYIDAGWELRS
jgi:preprotein translocase subunit SecA